MHTPGPWEEGEQHEGMIWVTDTKHGRICQMVGSVFYGSMEANARLVCAAPALLEACKNLAAAYSGDATMAADDCLDAHETALAAIAKAEGREV